MARQKNRGYQQNLSPQGMAVKRIRRWKMGAYIRLSREDLLKIKKGLDDSNSVKNQRDILSDFYENHLEEFESYCVAKANATRAFSDQSNRRVGVA